MPRLVAGTDATPSPALSASHHRAAPILPAPRSPHAGESLDDLVPPPDITIQIGRIEIGAPPAPPKPPASLRAPARRPSISLAGYLAARG